MLFCKPLAQLSPFSGKRRSTCTLKSRAGTVLVPPANRRVECNGSGAPSGMMAQPQSAHGCAVCGAPSDPLDETREPAKRAVYRGKRLLVTFGLSKGTRPSPKGGRNPFEGKALASCMAKPCQSGERECVSPPADHKKTAAQGLNASQLSLTGIVFIGFLHRILLWSCLHTAGVTPLPSLR